MVVKIGRGRPVVTIGATSVTTGARVVITLGSGAFARGTAGLTRDDIRTGSEKEI